MAANDRPLPPNDIGNPLPSNAQGATEPTKPSKFDRLLYGTREALRFGFENREAIRDTVGFVQDARSASRRQQQPLRGGRGRVPGGRVGGGRGVGARPPIHAGSGYSNESLPMTGASRLSGRGSSGPPGGRPRGRGSGRGGRR